MKQMAQLTASVHSKQGASDLKKSLLKTYKRVTIQKRYSGHTLYWLVSAYEEKK